MEYEAEQKVVAYARQYVNQFALFFVRNADDAPSGSEREQMPKNWKCGVFGHVNFRGVPVSASGADTLHAADQQRIDKIKGRVADMMVKQIVPVVLAALEKAQADAVPRIHLPPGVEGVGGGSP